MKALEFDEIAKSIIYTDKYQSLKDEPHHGLNRYIHCLNVAKMTYNLARLFKLDYISATRGALLHDYFNDCDYKEIRGIKKNSMHPIIALLPHQNSSVSMPRRSNSLATSLRAV